MSRFGCAICTDALDENTNISATKCGHVFHDACLRQWLASNGTCPHCRTSIRRTWTRALDISKLYLTKHDDTGRISPTPNDEMARLEKKYRRMKLRKAKMKDEIIALKMQLEEEIGNHETRVKTLKANFKRRLREMQKQNIRK